MAYHGPRPAQAPAAAYTPAVAIALADPSLYLNRELSWLEFNQRVLDGEAAARLGPSD